MGRERLRRSSLSQTRVLGETRAETTSTTPTSDHACLVFIAGEHIGKKLDLDQTELSVGRDPRCDLTIDSDLVSRNHAKIVSSGDTAILVDLGSTNGSFINDQRVTEKILQDGDRIAFGQVVMKYLGRGSAEAGYHDEVYRLVNYDGLTDAYNKRFFDEHLTSETRSGHGVVSVIVFDADHFKSINDTHGHAAGDAVLRQLSACARQCVQDSCYLARVGGEEFSVLAPNLDSRQAVQLAESIRSTVDEHDFRFEDSTIPVTVSVGVATSPKGSQESGQELFKRADEQLYLAKQQGRNRVCH